MAITRKELLRELMPGINQLFEDAYKMFNPMYGAEARQFVGDKLRKEDAHKYETEAKDMPIEACVNMWIIKYGSGDVPATSTSTQDKLIWEIGNRLWWANHLKYDEQTDSYEVIE